MRDRQKLRPRLGDRRVERLIGRQLLRQERPHLGFLQQDSGVADRQEGEHGDAEPEFAAELERAGQQAEGPAA